MQLPLISKGWRSIKRLLPVLFAISFATVLLLNNLTPATAQLSQSPHQEIRGVCPVTSSRDSRSLAN